MNPVCIADAASSPGAKKSEYETPPSVRRVAVVDEMTEPDADPEQEQHRIRDADHDRAAPGTAVERQPVAEDVPGATACQSISERPVSFRKTSSRVARRTSAVIGVERQRRAPRASAASPSSA